MDPHAREFSMLRERPYLGWSLYGAPKSLIWYRRTPPRWRERGHSRYLIHDPQMRQGTGGGPSWFNSTPKPGSQLFTHMLQNEVCGKITKVFKIMVHLPGTSFKSAPIRFHFGRVEAARACPSALEAYVLKNQVSENGHHCISLSNYYKIVIGHKAQRGLVACIHYKADIL